MQLKTKQKNIHYQNKNKNKLKLKKKIKNQKSNFLKNFFFFLFFRKKIENFLKNSKGKMRENFIHKIILQNFVHHQSKL